MKRFVYLDTDTINSYLSQIDDGLLEVSKNALFSQTGQTKSESEKETECINKIELGIPAIANLGISEGGNSTETIRSMLNTEMVGDILSKRLHDNAYSKLYNHLMSNGHIKTTIKEAALGEYVLIKSNFYVVDLDFLTKSSLIDNFKKIYPHFVDKTNSTNEKIKNQKIKNEIKGFDFGVQMLNFTSEIIPFTKFILSDDYFIPLENNFFRENLNSIKYKYPGESFILAEKTGTIKNTLLEQKKLPQNGKLLTNLISSFDEVTISVMKEIGINLDASIFNPIAWYYEWI